MNDCFGRVGVTRIDRPTKRKCLRSGGEWARKYVLSQVSSKMIEKLDISVKAEGFKPLNLTIEIDLTLSQNAKFDAQKLVKQTIEEAFKASEN